MKEDLDVSELSDAIERMQRGYRKPLPGTSLQPSAPELGSGDEQQITNAKSQRERSR
jgi:hypothetical protein